MAFQDWVPLSAGKRREINMNRLLARSQSLGCISKLLSLRLSFRHERGCVILLKSYWITDIIMTTLGLKTLREEGGTFKQVPSSPGTSQCPTGSLLTVFNFCIIGTCKGRREMLGLGWISTIGNPQLLNFFYL